MKKSMNSRRPALRRPQANTIWLFLGPRSGWSGSMSLSRSAAHLVWKSARVIVPAATSFASAAIAVRAAGSRRAHSSLRPRTTRASSPPTSEKRVPPSAISWIAWSNGIVTQRFEPRGPARLRTFRSR